MARKPPVIHARDHLPDGADPLDFPAGVLVGTSGFDLAYAAPGSLMYLYRCGDSFAFPTSGATVADALIDTSLFDSIPRNLDYREESAVAGWTTANRPTLTSLEHAALGLADDGCVRFDAGASWLSPFGAYPGALFEGVLDSGVDLTWATVGNRMQTAICWHNPDPAGSTANVAGATKDTFLCGNWNGIFSGLQGGWMLAYSHYTGQFRFQVSSGSVNTMVLFGPAGVIRGDWYMVAVTWDGTTWTLYYNAVPVATVVAGSPGGSSGQTFRIGGTRTKFAAAGYEYFAFGAVDDVSGWSSCLTQAELAAIFAASGYGHGVTGTTIHVGTPGAGDPAAISSATSSGNAPTHQVVASDGAGGSTYEYPTHGVYVGGA